MHTLKLLRLSRVNIATFAKQTKSEKGQLSEQDIDNILYKNVKPFEEPKIPSPQTMQSTMYDKDINTILTDIEKARSAKQESKQRQEESESQDQNNEQPKQEIIFQEDKDQKVESKKRMKYGLPLPQEVPQLVSEYWTAQEKKTPTPTINLFEMLRLDKDFTVEEYENKVHDFLNVEEMYGKQIEAPGKELQRQQILLGEHAVPMLAINDQKYMDQIKECFKLNMTLPGCLENEHPHRFLKNLRPVEEFRHTPLIPISERQMRDFNERIEIYRRKAYFLEVKKESIYQFAFGMVIFTIMFQMLRVALKKEEDYGVAFQRLKYKRRNQHSMTML